MELKLRLKIFLVAVFLSSQFPNHESYSFIEEITVNLSGRTSREMPPSNCTFDSPSSIHEDKEELQIRHEENKMSNNALRKHVYYALELLVFPVIAILLQFPGVKLRHAIVATVIKSLLLFHFLSFVHDGTVALEWLAPSACYSAIAVAFQWWVLQARDELLRLEQRVSHVNLLGVEVEMEFLGHVVYVSLLMATFFGHGSFLSQVSFPAELTPLSDVKDHVMFLIVINYLPALTVLLFKTLLVNQLKRELLESPPQLYGG